MNIALIFAGGTGIRMSSRTKPKQFLEMHGKAIIIYTIEVFEKHPEIDEIVVVCISEWIDYLNDLIRKAGIKKVVSVIPGGRNTQESQYFGLLEIDRIRKDKNPIVLIHDGVRPLVDADTISSNIASVKENGSAITVTPAIETIISVNSDGELIEVVDRSNCKMAKAPQSYYLNDILSVHLEAKKNNKTDYIDSACMMQDYGRKLFTVDGNEDNIKITTPKDFYLFRAIIEAKENSQIWG